MSEFTPLRDAVETLASRSPAPDFGELKRRAIRRSHRRVAMVAAAVIAVIAGSALAGLWLERDERSAPVIEQPKLEVGAVPVWYDARGLHRGDVVEQTPVDLVVAERTVGKHTVLPASGALALVRSGAVYLDPATGDVWFHPWGGRPRIVGHNSEAGPGGDPNGDTAAWFEGSDAPEAGPGELVIYDTATGRVISRTRQSHRVAADAGGEHMPAGNGFLQVSAERVVWTDHDERVYSHDVHTKSTSVLEGTKEQRFLADVHDGVEAFSDHLRLVLKAPGQAEQRYPDVEGLGRLNSNGDSVLAVEDTDERHGAVIIDTKNGGLWRVPKDAYSWLAWSYGDIAMVDHTDDELLACDAARRTCEPLPAVRPFLLPTT